MTITIHAKRFDSGPNDDEIVLKDKAGLAYALVHADLFWDKDDSEIYEALKTTEGGLHLSISIAEEDNDA